MTRRLDGEEKVLWGKVVATVKPLHPVRPALQTARPAKLAVDKPAKRSLAAKTVMVTAKSGAEPTKPSPPPNTLDGSWDRRIGKGVIIPDINVDLHGQGLSSAYRRLDEALEQAVAEKLRVILLVTGKARAHDRTSGQGRGAIASVVRDWLAASRHSSSISAVRNAHPRHGGTGALYIILKR